MSRLETTGQAETNLEPIRFDVAQMPTATPANVEAHWTGAMPVLTGQRMMLRELVKTDATSLLSMLATEEVAKFISPPPTTPEGFEKFIQWAIRERQAGNQMTTRSALYRSARSRRSSRWPSGDLRLARPSGAPDCSSPARG